MINLVCENQGVRSTLTKSVIRRNSVVQYDALYIYVKRLCKVIRLILESEIKNEHMIFLVTGVIEISEKETKKVFDCYLS